jgi:hypothetical protein
MFAPLQPPGKAKEVEATQAAVSSKPPSPPGFVKRICAGR